MNPISRYLGLSFSILFISTSAWTQTSVALPQPTKGQLLMRDLKAALQCVPSPQEESPCNVFLAESALRCYNYKGFVGPTRRKVANEIFDDLKKESMEHQPSWPKDVTHWHSLGELTDQSVLEQAQDFANKGALVVAARHSKGPEEKGMGHVALILPGKLQRSGHWNNMLVPNSAASSTATGPTDRYINGPLSNAFGIKYSDDKKSVVYDHRVGSEIFVLLQAEKEGQTEPAVDESTAPPSNHAVPEAPRNIRVVP